MVADSGKQASDLVALYQRRETRLPPQQIVL
jgi:hypothetical protein